MFSSKLYPCNQRLLFVMILLTCLATAPSYSENIDDGGEGNCCVTHRTEYDSFISERMKHLTAVNNIKNIKNAVKKYQLVVDLCKTLFQVLDKNRKSIAGEGLMNVVDLSALDKKLKSNLIEYIENTAVFCDLLVFFPEITAKLLEKNLLWRITLIDSIQDAMSLDVTFVDDNTRNQFEKAFKILSEGAPAPEPKIEKKSKAVKKSVKKRGPRLAAEEL